MTIPLQPVVGDNADFDAYCSQLREHLPANGRLLLVQIPQVILGSFNRDIALKRGYYAFPPTGLQYLYEAIKHRGVDVRILDLNYELLKRVFEDPGFDHNNWHVLLEDELDRFDPGIVGVSCLFDMAIGPMLDVLERVRRRNRSVVIAGGVIATYEWKNLLSQSLAHFVVRGEGENKLNYLLDKLTEKNLGTKPTPGIFFNDGELRESRGNPDVVMVHGNLIDSYNLVPIETYSKYGSLNPYSRQTDALGHAFAAIQLTRGCRAECTFCAVRDFMGKGVRSRSIDCVIEEMQFLYEKRDVRHFEWLDDDLLFDRHQIKDLLSRIIAKGWDIKWSANNGLIASSIDEEMMDLIQRSGCIGFKIGIETGNTEMLRKVKKPGTHRRFLAFSKMVESYPGPFIGGNFIVGLPGETFGQMMDSLRFSLEMNIDWSPLANQPTEWSRQMTRSSATWMFSPLLRM
ncbi:MAG: radical SAM protein [Betaproteobacteria bacterium]|nr:radical SAM protein [Betaproteobacteria bacterium]